LIPALVLIEVVALYLPTIVWLYGPLDPERLA
jgi:hypothetical protein